MKRIMFFLITLFIVGDQPVSCFHLYRNGEFLEEVQGIFYLDENLPNGNYIYHVRVVYADGCETLSYNTATVTIGTEGIASTTLSNQIMVYPNPTNGMINVQCLMINVQNIEIFDVFGRIVGAKNPLQKLEGCPKDRVVFNISHLPSGIYFVRITTENSVVVRKVIKSER